MVVVEVTVRERLSILKQHEQSTTATTTITTRTPLPSPRYLASLPVSSAFFPTPPSHSQLRRSVCAATCVQAFRASSSPLSAGVVI